MMESRDPIFGGVLLLVAGVYQFLPFSANRRATLPTQNDNGTSSVSCANGSTPKRVPGTTGIRSLYDQRPSATPPSSTAQAIPSANSASARNVFAPPALPQRQSRQTAAPAAYASRVRNTSPADASVHRPIVSRHGDPSKSRYAGICSISQNQLVAKAAPIAVPRYHDHSRRSPLAVRRGTELSLFISRFTGNSARELQGFTLTLKSNCPCPRGPS